MFMDITNLSSGSFNYITETSIEGVGFNWSDLFTKPDSMMKLISNMKYMEPTINSLYYMLFNIVLYVLLALFLDNVMPNIFGNRKPIYYFLLPSYWGFGNTKNIDEKEWINKTQKKYKKKINFEDLDDDVRKHYEETCDPEFNKSPMKIINLHKRYGNTKKNRKVVVKNTCLSIDENKVLALLGQNGAGKSTTINIITGLTSPTSGDVYVYGKSLRNNISGVQGELGICPQHDILYNDLTAMEHLRLYSGLKGIKASKELEEILLNRLKAVRLYTVKDAKAKTYSGGMKRRLSMIIATIGDPRVILLDEPTTGMDPLNRRHVWRFIEKFKKNRCILLTTHSMEEADAIGDDIIIMSNGEIKALGNGIHLKNKFGNGYRISILVKDNRLEEVKEIASNMVPGIHLEDDSAGSLIYDFSAKQSEYIPKFVKYLDGNPDDNISSWGISQTTLEEVFLLVIHDETKIKNKK